jgi:hypothetical protein
MRAACAVTLLTGLAVGATVSPAVTVPARAATPALITDDQAQAQAISTNSAVVVTADSTPMSQTTAEPDGTFVATVSSEPMQEFVSGSWQAINPALAQNADGSYSPTVSSAPLSLSGGGTTTLATMTADGRTMTISWPTTLPAPTVSGNTATYPNVYSGVNLVVTDDGQGGFSDTLVVSSATAAANPALASIQLSVSTSPGLVLSTDASGDLIASADPTAPALLGFAAPQIWDSTAAPSTEATATNTDGVTVDAATGDPVASSVSGPGSAANIATIPVSLSGDTLTLTPPASVLTGASTTYPVYIDPAWHNFAPATVSKFTQVFSGMPTNTSMYDKAGDLRVGACPADYSSYCNGIGVARSYIEFNMPKKLHRNTYIHSAELYSTEDWSTSCTAEPVKLWSVSGQIGAGTDWNSAPALSGTSTSQTAAYGYPGCGYYKDDVTFTVTSTIAADAGVHSYQTFALQAGNETADSTGELYWKKFKSSDFTLSVKYNDPPNQPDDLRTSAGGGCRTSSANPALIGKDDITFYSHAYDPDNDNNLVTTFNLYNSSGTSVYSASDTTGDGGRAQTQILESKMITFGTNGSTTAYKYYYQTSVKDPFGLTSPASDKCWILYNPNNPGMPTVSYTVNGTAVTSATIGASVTATFSEPGCSSTTNPCPAKYTWQEGATKPVTETLTSGVTTWTGLIPITHIGPIDMTVHAIDASGNVSEAATVPLTGTPPTTTYKDGYFSDSGHPDILHVGTGSKPSLWLYPGNGTGTVGNPVDIGSAGDAISPGTDGRGDWKGATIVQGDFTGHNVQDVLAYYPYTPGSPPSSSPTPGTGVIIGGTGDAFPLNPWSGNGWDMSSDNMTNGTQDVPPTQLADAGNISGLSTNTDDLVGISNDGTSSELDLYTSGIGKNTGTPGAYSWCATITPTAPGGPSDSWANYQIATAGTPSAMVVYALDTTTGALYAAAGPFTVSTASGTCGFGASVSTTPKWTSLTVPWTTSNIPPDLIQGDINASGTPELWFDTGLSFLAYTISGTTVSVEDTPSYSTASDDWALNDGNPNLGGATATTALDSTTGTSATITGNIAWVKDTFFGTDLSLDGTNASIVPPSATIPSGTRPSISLWFKTLKPGVIVSTQSQPVSDGGSVNGDYNPVLYIGKNGLLYGELWNGSLKPAASTLAVDDGVWHHAQIESTGGCVIQGGTENCVYTQTLYLDGTSLGAITGATSTANWSNLTFGAGYIGGGWPNYPNSNAKNGNYGWPTYFDGELSNITISD